MATLFLGTTCRAANQPPILTRASEIRGLRWEEAAKGLPVRLRGIVIYRSGGSAFFYVPDGHDSVTIQLFRANQRKIRAGGELPATENEPGAVIEIEGITDSSGYAPAIDPIRFHRIGTAPLPPPLAPSIPDLSKERCGRSDLN